MGSQAHRMRRTAAARAETLRFPGERLTGYACPDGHRTITAAIDPGNLPETLGCRHEPGHCGNQAHREPAGIDIPDHLLPPAWEWHKPTTEQLSRFRQAGGPLWQHVNRGGLVLRRRRTTT